MNNYGRQNISKVKVNADEDLKQELNTLKKELEIIMNIVEHTSREKKKIKVELKSVMRSTLS